MNARLLPATSAFLLALVFDTAATTRYVDLNNPSPTPPYTSWPTAATNIQDAIDAAVDSDLILVTNGVYQTGGRLVSGPTTNRVAVTKAVTIQSVNGPLVTIIQGYQVPGTPTGSGAIRCVYLTNGASLNGFTLTNGATQNNDSGGGIRSQSISTMVTNCVLVGNAATRGGGTSSGTLNSCTLSNNYIGSWGAQGGGADGSVLNDCLISSNSAPLGGGAYSSILNNCILLGNSGSVGASRGAGVHSCHLTNCLISGNYTDLDGGGGGAYGGTLNNCVLTNNSAGYGGGAYFATLNCCVLISNFSRLQGGGVRSGALYNCTVVGNWTTNQGGGTYQTANYNCIVYSNFAPQDPNGYQSTFNYCWTNDPNFVNFAAGDFRLQTNSPCINAGNNTYVTNSTDLDGNPRIVGGTVDIGAYECQSPALLDYYLWLQSYGLPTSASTTYSDTDGDGMSNWGEWRSDTIPTNAPSALRMVIATNSPSGMKVTWQSVATRSYFLERATNLGVVSPFQTIATNMAGVAGVKTYTDTTATNGGPYFYRVGVQ